MRSSTISAVVLFSAFATGVAQDLRFHEKLEIRLIEVNAVVTDRDGHRVYGLTADDSEIYEGHARQAITNFAEYRSAPEPAATSDASTVPVSPRLQPPQQQREPHSLLIILDSLPRTDFVREKMFQQLDELLTKVVRDGDHVAVVSWDAGYERSRAISESSDPAVVMRAVRDYAGRMKANIGDDPTADGKAEGGGYSVAGHPEIAARDKMGGLGSEKSISETFGDEAALNLLRRKALGIQHLIEPLGARPGKKAALYVSDTFRLEGDAPAFIAAKRYINGITQAANANGVTFYAVHPFMPDDTADASSGSAKHVNPEDWIRFSGALGRLTDPTGGLLDFGRASIASLAPQIAEDLESYYSIAYRAKSDGGDHVRNIVVKTKNPAYRVRSRNEVVEKSNATKAKELVVTRLFTDEGSNDLRFAIQEGTIRHAASNRWLLPIVVKIPASQIQFASERGRQVAHVGILIASANGLTEVTPVSEDELRVDQDKDVQGGFVTYSVQIMGDKRGSKVSIGVVDRLSGAIGVRTIDNRGRFR
jgi:VWFA-related protein